MKVIVDLDKCQGHGLCKMAGPDVFELAEEDGHSIVKYPDGIPAELEDQAAMGVEACPEIALSIED